MMSAETGTADRELLELAAKAAGYTVQRDPIDNRWRIQKRDGQHPDLWPRWNPLHDDGDALRLAVRLNLQVLIGQGPDGDITWVRAPGELDIEGPSERHEADAFAATRRAIVRAAAEIGKVM